ncbi:MAG: Asp-tRNA(Asn)/Glu-tRNA(Gln) amidotransferase subunit GatB [Candidatus Midichloria sp.]|uniref:Glutamyl-tRNA(Gln) amidotransferase subunit B, mitochondrial n=1 Tax=Hyalomma marginatum TaxID=34627 RepID=A0A8S4C3J0_9ACAR|nr:Asp-tRNA(Asn)/Glu-tRNA(Gln) amidotransferase subunit GatB [Hyalomma marginatum]CAG7589460.1 Asp-tRNA(Asn)/Glu-tRNA(Gln) amidotransferase subunit GatB [Hyalomma marginatum]
MSYPGQIIKGKNKWEVVIGLEVHSQIASESKLFSRSKTEFGAEPNSQVSFIDAAMPGMLPSINGKCVEQAVKTGLGIGAQINLFSCFDRKNYFYPDLPQGYQISQFRHPIVSNGRITIELPDKQIKTIGVTRIHIEQDAGKSIHDHTPDETFVDLNRSGIALMEIVTEPDMRSSEEAAEFLKKLRSILRYLGSCDGDMEKGSLRCDANVSVKPLGSDKYGTRVEIKNVNSVKFVIKAINYEAMRQVELLESGGEVLQETRLFDSNEEVTKPMRTKEDAVDYRYFPDPDLLPLILSEEYVENIRKALPELPDAKVARYISTMGISDYDANVIVADKNIADYFEATAALTDPKLAANWIIAELFGKLNKANLEIIASPIKPGDLAALIELIRSDVVSGKIAKQVFELMFETQEEPKALIEKHGLVQVTNNDEIEKFVDHVLAANPEKVTEYRAGKEKLFGFFVGQVMQISEGKVNPSILNDILKKKL